MKLLLAGALFAVLAFGRDTGRGMPSDDSEDPVFSLFRLPDVVKPPPQVIAARAAEGAVLARVERVQRKREAGLRRRQAVRLEGCFAALALFGILGPALFRQLKIVAAEVVSVPGSASWRELQRVDLCGKCSAPSSQDKWQHPPSHAGRYEAPWLDRLLISAAGGWLDKIPVYGHKPPKAKLDQFLASAKFLDSVPEYLVPS